MTTPTPPVINERVCPDWQKIVDVPARYHTRSSKMHIDPSERAISIRQLEQLGALIERVLSRKYYPKKSPDANGKFRTIGQLTKINISMYEINDIFVKPLTDGCSYVEMVAEKPQKPNFFVSHYWGTSFFDTLRMLKLHAKHRNLSETDSFYWMCTFANNQHYVDLNTDDTDFRNTPFARALLTEGCKGTLLLLDEYKATPFSRIWCVFELFITTILSRQRSKLEPLLFDIGTIIPALECENELGERNRRCAGVLLEDGKGDVFSGDHEFTDHPEGGVGTSGLKRAWFPARVAKHGFLADVRDGKATREEDTKWILSVIEGKEDKVNQAVRRKLFRSAAYMSATALGSPGMLKYVMTKSDVASKQRALEIADEDGIVSATAGYSYYNKRNDCLQFLLNFGCNPNVVSASRRGETERHPLESACRVKNPSHVSILLRHGSDPNFTYGNGGPTLEEKIGDPKVMVILRSYDPGLKNHAGVEKRLRKRWRTGSIPNQIKGLFANVY